MVEAFLGEEMEIIQIEEMGIGKADVVIEGG